MRSRVLQTPQAGRGQDQRIVVAGVELAQPRIEIAADRQERGAREQPRELRDAPDAARADARRAARALGRRPRASDAASAAPAARPRRADPRAAARRRSRARPGSTAGMSLLLWTARSISPASSASSISFTNSRLPPISDSGASASRSPEVLMTTISQSMPACVSQQRGDGVGLKERELAAARARASVWPSTIYLCAGRLVSSPPRPVELGGGSPVRRRNRRLTASV